MAWLNARGLRHHVIRLGEGGAPVVFLHGLVMDNLSSWYFTVGAKAAAERAVVLLDLRGHGRTERPATGYGMDAFVADLAAVLDGLEIAEPVTLVGNSFGGQLAATFASRHPQRVRDLVLVDAHLGRDGWGDAMAETLSLQGEDRDRAIATHFASWLGRHSERKRNRLARTAQELVHETTLVADLQASPPLDDAGLARLTMPILALYGEASDVRDEADRLADHARDVTLRIFPAATHSLLWEQTDDVVEAVLTRLRR